MLHILIGNNIALGWLKSQSVCIYSYITDHLMGEEESEEETDAQNITYY